MVNKVLLTYAVFDFIFVAMGIVIIVFSTTVQKFQFEVPTDGKQAARNLLYQRFPFTAAIINSVGIFITFVITVPGLITPVRSWLKVGAYLTTVNAIFTLVIGLYLWIQTLRTKGDFAPIWGNQTAAVQDLMQAAFQCCGYFNSTSPAFVTNPTCQSPASAALMRGCATPITSFANIFVDDIFTSLFGMVGIDVAFVVATACLLKQRKERERFRHIDEKSGALRGF
ncbi:hypothetical protein B0T26DRAFT_30494 [Lasiosphaeria miniovina]|uniref:Tetraspanin n=1 Tax=Lasiosphaeria miniovina TaxID=1954250 RepID=A0AA40BG52_9PEZI|nr:uncharacterized protein B0T26DRAFT_30494 [Lasiosphaeria miniovina]KAK0733632.1 hypothetical protein B0T26DRAFT_30494 [Lasiosphaeria miniovina]